MTEENCDELVAAVSGKKRRQVEEILAARAPRPDTPSMIQSTSPRTEPLLTIAPATTKPTPQLRVEPLAQDRYEVRFTASRAFCEKLERVRDLMSHRNPRGEYEGVFDAALDLMLAQLEKERLGKTNRPRNRRKTKAGRIASATRREVVDRDGEQCTFIDESTGCRCTSRHRLELDHVVPRACGGTDKADNLRVVCRAHNRLYAEKVFGRAHVAQKIEEQRKEAAPPTEESADAYDVASRALKSMGFKGAETGRAVITLRERHRDAAPPPIESLVTEALRLLT